MAQKILYFVSEDWYFISHRLPMARSAKAAGYEVHVATRVDKHGQQIVDEGFILHPVKLRRGSLNVIRFFAAVMQIRRIYRRFRPDLVHHVALVPSVVGSIAALGLPMARLNALTGLGYTFASTKMRARLVRMLANPLLGCLLRRPGTTVLVQNPDDRAVAQMLNVPPDHIVLIPGSGVDVNRLTPLPEPQSLFTVGFVGRLLDDKGVRTLIAAHEILRGRNLNVRTVVAGDRDPANPASISKSVLSEWRKLPGLALLGHVSDVRAVWLEAHVAVLPSRREGLPKSLLEAAACGRPLIATDVPGCREIARGGVNALLVPLDDPSALAEAIETLMNDGALRAHFGRASRQIVVDNFSNDRVKRDIVALYAKILGNPREATLRKQATS